VTNGAGGKFESSPKVDSGIVEPWLRRTSLHLGLLMSTRGDLWKILVNTPFHLNSAQAADCNPNINLQNMAQSPLSTCYSGYSNQIISKRGSLAALFVFCGKFHSGRARLSAVPITAIDEAREARSSYERASRSTRTRVPRIPIV
jgi:hypothetical protein